VGKIEEWIEREGKGKGGEGKRGEESRGNHPPRL
jgi:hypothetical protein